MSKTLSYDEIVAQIKNLDEIYRDCSVRLVQCNSFSQEQKVKEEMFECEVKKKILKRKLEAVAQSA